MAVRKKRIWLPEEYGDFSSLLNTFSNWTKMFCFYWVLITIFKLSVHIFQKELAADVKTARTPLIQNQAFPPATVLLQHLPKSTLSPKTTHRRSGHVKKSKGGCRRTGIIPKLCCYFWTIHQTGERKIQISGFFFPTIWAFSIEMQQADTGGVKTQFNWKGILCVRCCQAGVQRPGRAQPQALHPGKDALKGKGTKGWANETNTLQAADLQRCHLLDSLWKTKFFARSDMIQAHQSTTKVLWLIWDPSHTSCPFLEQLQSRWVWLYPQAGSYTERPLLKPQHFWCFTRTILA